MKRDILMKLFLISLFFLSVFLFIPQKAFANNTPTVFEGILYAVTAYSSDATFCSDWDGRIPLANHGLWLNCGSSDSYQVTTDNNGYYHIEIPKDKCDAGNVFEYDIYGQYCRSVSCGSPSGGGKVSPSRVVSLDKDVIFCERPTIPTVPEFGVLTSAIASIGSVGGYLFMKYKIRK